MFAKIPVPSLLLLLFTAVCCWDETRCCVVDDGDVVVLATVADDTVLPAVVMVTADDDGKAELEVAANAAAIPASRRLRINPTRQIIKRRIRFTVNYSRRINALINALTR